MPLRSPEGEEEREERVRERDIGADGSSEGGDEGHEREMCVRMSVHERLSSTINPRYLASYPTDDVRSQSEQNGNVFSCRNLF